LIGFNWKTRVVVLVLVLAGCSNSDNAGANGTDTNRNDTADAQQLAAARVYVTVAGHIEPSPAYHECTTGFPKYRKLLLNFAKLIADTPIRFNLQIDRTFLEGVRDCEDDAMRAKTDGQSVLDYLVAQHNFELDPHVEGGFEKEGENYADIRYLLGDVSDSPTETVGGWRWDSQSQFDELNNGQTGQMFGGFTWLPDVLTLAVSSNHHNGDFTTDDLTSGVWMPLGANDGFLKHNAAGRLVYVAPGQQHSDWSGKGECKYRDAADYAGALIAHIDSGTLPAAAIYTATLAVPQSVMFKTDNQAKLMDIIDRLTALQQTGSVVFAHYSQVVTAWNEEYNSAPNIVTFDQLDPTTYTCP
jgi:hypothetical protein